MKFINSRGRAIAICLVALIALFVLTSSLLKGSQQDQKKSVNGSRIQANLIVAFRGESVIIRNDNHFDWTNTKIALQHGSRTYYYQAGTIGKGETKGFLMEAFISPEGEPFNHRKYKAEKVSITAAETEGSVVIDH